MRRAGTSAGERFKELSHIWRRRLRLIWLALFTIAAGFGLAGWFVPGQAKWYLALVAGAAGGVTVALRDTPPPYIEAWRLGQEGERRTAKRLKRLTSAGWSAWHDLASDGRGNVDHVVLGQAGVFLLDSKNYLGEMTFGDGVLRIRWVEDPDDGWEARTLTSAAKRASAKLSDRIGRACGMSPWVQPVVVLWGRFEQGAVEHDGVWLVRGDDLEEWLRARPPQLDQLTVRRLADALDALASPSPASSADHGRGAPRGSEVAASRDTAATSVRGTEPNAVESVEDARAYIAAVRWTFAKTMPKWPHEYTVRDWRPELAPAFVGFAKLIRREGIVKPWPRNAAAPRYHHHYLQVDGWEYWTMEEPIAQTEVINRARPS